jgi:hypothetical protein
LAKIEKKYQDSQALLEYLKDKPQVSKAIIEKLQKRTAHYRMRSSLQANRLKRILPVLLATVQGNYQLQDGGKWWHPILGDILE